MRVAATLAYDGSEFFGSQIQKENNQTVFGVFEHILQQLGIESKTVASGRTDRGVHATGQVCSFDIPEFWQDIKRLQKTLNKMLPSSMVVKNIKQVDDDFHARYSAKKRTYRYIISTKQPNPFLAKYITFLAHIDSVQMQKNANCFVGEHDFSNFMKSGSDVSSTTRVIYEAKVYEHKEFTVLKFVANGFLRTQIRFMVAAILHLNPQQIDDILTSKAKLKIKPAPSNGLYLTRINY